MASKIGSSRALRVASVSLPFLLAGCASTPAAIVGPSAMEPVPAYGQSGYSSLYPTTYLLRPTDRISVVVYREPELSTPEVRIGVEGNVSLPMIGSIRAAGMTAKELEQDVNRRLVALGLRSPMVSVNITDFASHLVTVEGAVTNPGVYSFQPGARLSSAIALAAGPMRTARTREVAVFRTSPEGIMVAKFDYGQISQGTMLDPVLEPGDRVVMGTNGLSAFWQDFLRAAPVFGTFLLVATR